MLSAASAAFTHYNNTLLPIPFRILLLPVPAVAAHIINVILRLPAQFPLRLAGIRVTHSNITGTAILNHIGNRNTTDLFKSMHHFQHTVAPAGTQVINGHTAILFNGLQRLHMPFGQVHHMDVVPHTGAVRCGIVIPKHMQLIPGITLPGHGYLLYKKAPPVR